MSTGIFAKQPVLERPFLWYCLSMPGIRIEAPAKLNLCLLVGDKRPDGFHGIESLFIALAFGDTLHIETVSETDAYSDLSSEWGTGDSISMEWDTSFYSHNNLKSFNNQQLFIPPENNIICQAVSLFRKYSGYDRRFKIAVEKRIPPGSGLGGGSSNAAATLLALNHLVSFENKQSLSDAALAGIGKELGSDVPFFVRQDNIAAWVSGRGEIITPIPLLQSLNGLSFVLVNPGFSSDTAGAYRLLDNFRQKHFFRQPSVETHKRSFSKLPVDWRLNNDFLSVFLTGEGGTDTSEGCGAVYRKILNALRDLGADCAGLSGSGSTCFGVFSSPDAGAEAVEFLSKYWPLVVKTFPLARYTKQRYNY